MEQNLEKSYNPADDDNQGVAQLLAQGEQANTGAEQAPALSPTVHTTDPEPVGLSEEASAGGTDEQLMEED